MFVYNSKPIKKKIHFICNVVKITNELYCYCFNTIIISNLIINIQLVNTLLCIFAPSHLRIILYIKITDFLIDTNVMCLPLNIMIILLKSIGLCNIVIINKICGYDDILELGKRINIFSASVSILVTV